MNKKKKILFGIILLWVLVLTLSSYYYFDDIEKYIFYNPEEIGDRKLPYKWWLIGHFAAASCTLFLGPLQFIPYIRNRFIKFHRFSGKLYIIGSLISAVTVFVLLGTTYSLPGAIPSLGFLAIIWIFTTLMAYFSIRKRNIKLHKQFMIRSYVCGFAFVFIRLLPELNYFTGIFNFIEDDTMRYTIYEWICWVYPLIITEFFLTWKPQIKKIKL
ncbi:DUF2306 domain-containing protein [Gelidibacter japonicus]|uniref:DUF2306 domain-containing protein n=1 Tax=Gelidibacter japonicus TaxID=1962232 RepID=UPI003A8FF0D9